MSETTHDTGEHFECDGCGACCKGHLIVECEDIDVMREPRLIEGDPFYEPLGVLQSINILQNEYGRCVTIACGSACRFLNEESLCSIYPTRPNVCVAFAAGSEQCQEVREAEGLPPLLPISPSSNEA